MKQSQKTITILPDLGSLALKNMTTRALAYRPTRSMFDSSWSSDICNSHKVILNTLDFGQNQNFKTFTYRNILF